MIVEGMASTLVAALLTAHPPVGCVIDCSGWDGKQTTEITFWIVTLDEQPRREIFVFYKNSDPDVPQECFMFFFRAWAFDLEYERIGRYRYFVRGSKAAPVRRVVAQADPPDGWIPNCYFVWTFPPYEAPPPRVVVPK